MRPDAIEKYHAKVAENIEKYGYHVTFVFDEETPSFCYSTGLFKSFTIPELFISALPQNLSFELVENYVGLFRSGKAVPVRERIYDIWDLFPVYLVPVKKSSLKDYALTSRKVYGRKRYEYLQLIYPDTKGLFPNELGYDYDQEILGEFP